MKKVLAILIAAILLISLAACTNDPKDDDGTDSNKPDETTDITPGSGDETDPADETTGATEDTTAATEDTTAAPGETTGPAETENPIDPNKIQIGTIEQLKDFMNAPVLDGDYVLTADITFNDIANVANWATAAPANAWTPVGTATAPFTGTFDGMGHKITGLYVSVDEAAGFFGCISGATIKNLVIGEGFINATTKVAGGISGYYADNIRVESCVNLATIVSKSYVGGMIGCENGTITAGTITNCVNRGKIVGTGSSATTAAIYAGGMIGQFKSLVIESCANFGNVSVGFALDGSVVSEKGAIVGGIAGVMANAGASIKNCYNAGTISASCASGNVGAASIVGRMNNNADGVVNCYNIGKVLLRADGTSMEMNAYVAAPNASGTDYTDNVYNSGKMYNVASGSEVESTPKNTEAGLKGAVETGTGAAAKMNFDSSIWSDTTGAPILGNIDASWQVIS